MSGDHGYNLGEADSALDRGEYDRAAWLVDHLVTCRLLDQEEVDETASSPFDKRLAAAEDLVRQKARERLLVLDPSGQIVLYLRGGASHVALPTTSDGTPDEGILQNLDGAHCITHNHPTEPGRPIGGTFSLSDIVLAQRFSIRHLRVAAREATYSLTPQSGASWDASSVARTQGMYLDMQARLDRAMGAAGPSAERDIYFFLRVFDFLMLQVAKNLSLRYTRDNRPRKDWWETIPTLATAAVETEGPTMIDDTGHFRWVSSILQHGTV